MSDVGKPVLYGRGNLQGRMNPDVAQMVTQITAKPSWTKVLGVTAMLHSLAPQVLSCHARA